MMVDYTQLCQALTLQQLNSLERHFLKLLDYNVGVKAVRTAPRPCESARAGSCAA